MPQGDRTGPMGQGPMTGRALGFCKGNNMPGASLGFGRGMRMGRNIQMGRGRGMGVGWNRSINREDEISMLKSTSEELSRSQKEVERRLNELDGNKD